MSRAVRYGFEVAESLSASVPPSGFSSTAPEHAAATDPSTRTQRWLLSIETLRSFTNPLLEQVEQSGPSHIAHPGSPAIPSLESREPRACRIQGEHDRYPNRVHHGQGEPVVGGKRKDAAPPQVRRYLPMLGD